MAQTVVITLTNAGADTGPFDLYSNVDGFAVAFESNVSKEDLEAGYVSVLVPDSASTIRVQSDNPLCDNYIDLVIVTTTTTSTSSTSTSSTTSTSTTTGLPAALIDVGTNLSIDVQINSVTVNAVPANYVGGQPLPNTSGNFTQLSTTQIGTYEVVVNYTATSDPQKITLTDSASTSTCQQTSPGTFDMTFINVVINVITDTSIVAGDGIC